MVQTSSSFNFSGIPTYFQDCALNLVDSPHQTKPSCCRFGWWQVLSHRRLKDWKRHWPLSPFGSTKPLCVLLNHEFSKFLHLTSQVWGDLWATKNFTKATKSGHHSQRHGFQRPFVFLQNSLQQFAWKKIGRCSSWYPSPDRYLADWLSFWTSKAWLVFLQKLKSCLGCNDVYFGADFEHTFGLECLPDIYPSWVSNLKRSASSVRRSWESWLTCPSSPKLAVEAIGREKKDSWLRVWTNQLYKPHSLQ